MTKDLLALSVMAFVVSAAMTGVLRNRALRIGLLDRPNERSSHDVPTPRGGGLAMVVALATCTLLAVALGLVDWRLAAAILLPGALVAYVGWRDDHGHVAPLKRLAVHLVAGAAGLAAISISMDGPLRGNPAWNLAVATLTWFACGWFLNLFNFMDGIDGIAAAEAVFLSVAAAVLLSVGGEAPGLVLLWALLSCAALGFFCWNWPPAQIFMGDVGSGFLGFVIGIMLVASDLYSESFSAWTSLALAAPFAADATVTLLRRILRGERWFSAHRTHAYQWLARRWRSHARVTALLLVLNVAMAFPLAWATVSQPSVAPLLAGSGFLASCLLAWFAGAGRTECRLPA